MLTMRTLLLIAAIICSGLSLAQAQQSTTPGAPVVTASGSAERVRFTAPSNVVRMQLQVISETGQVLFDVASKGNVLDWSLQDGSGQRLQGSYLTVVTVKSLSGRVSERIGSVSVAGKQVEIQPADPLRMSSAQQQAVGPVEENSSLTILKTGEAQATTVVANNGSDGQIIRDQGALSFRLGDFFSGTDTEQMRLTEAGNLGIGTDKPQAKLDVAGDIRASGALRVDKGVEFADGTVQTTGLSGRKDKEGNLVPNVGGTGTQNRIAKWTDNAGTLGDSLLSETAGAVEVRPGVAGFGVNPTILNPGNVSGIAQFQFYPATGPNTNMSFTVVPKGTGVADNKAQFSIFGTDLFADPVNYEFAALRARGTDYVLGSGKSGTGQTRPFMLAAGFLNDNLTNNGQLFLATNGKVGVGTTTPGAKLDVAGDINTSTQYNIGGNRMLSILGTNNILAGVGAGSVNAGVQNSFFGASAGAANTSALSNSFFGFNAGVATIGGGDNSFFGASSGAANTSGFSNAFFGRLAGQANTSGANNSFFGRGAGQTNSAGSNNTFVGSAADAASGNLDHATAIGAGAGVSTSNTIQLGRANGSDSVKVSGNLVVNGTLTATLPAGSANYIQNTTSPQATSNFNISGNGTAGGTLSGNIVNATTQFNIGGNRVLSVAGGGTFAGVGAGPVNIANNNAFFGTNAGLVNTTGDSNAFFGWHAGQNNTVGFANAFFGLRAGFNNTTGGANSFFGETAGVNNTTGEENSFFGRDTGSGNTTGYGNAFFANSAGRNNINGADNAFFGRSAGQANTSGSGNSFFGESAGYLNTEGANNVFFGQDAARNNGTGNNNVAVGFQAGSSNVAENNNTFIGTNSNGASSITNATAIGAFAQVTLSNSIVLGSINGTNGATANTKVGIGITAPSSVLHIVSNTDQLITASTSSNAGTWFNLANTDTGGRTWNLISTASTNGEGAGKLLVRDASANSVRMTFDTAGNVGIGTFGPLDKLQVAGDIRVGTGTTGCVKDADGTLLTGTCSSDARFKRNITPFPKLLDQLVRLQPVHFYWRATEYPDKAFGKSESFGLVAQEVEKVLPELVTEDEKGFKAVRYHELPLMMLQAIKEQQVEIAGQRKQIEVLKRLVCLDHPGADVCR